MRSGRIMTLPAITSTRPVRLPWLQIGLTLVGAAIGAATGALIGHAIQEDRAREYGPPPPGGYPFATRAGGPGMYRSPYTGRVYDLRGVPPGGLTRDVDTGQLFRRP